MRRRSLADRLYRRPVLGGPRRWPPDLHRPAADDDAVEGRRLADKSPVLNLIPRFFDGKMAG